MVNLICNNGAGRLSVNLLLLWAYCCHKAVVKLIQPMYVWLAVMVVDLLQFLALPSTRANRQYGNALADKNLLRALVQHNHAERYINA